MIEKDPGNNGAGKTIGLASFGWGYPACFGIQQAEPYIEVMAKKKDGKYVWPAAEPEVLDGILEVKSIIDEGLLWTDQSLAKVNDAPARFNAGQVGICYGNYTSNQIAKTVESFKKLYPDKDPSEVFGIMNLQDKYGHFYCRQNCDSWGSICFNAQISDEKLDKVLRMLDYLCSDEGLLLHHYGMEGTDYTLNSDGSVNVLWDKDDNGGYIDPYPINSDRILGICQLYEFEKGTAVTTDPTVRKICQEAVDYLNKSPEESYRIYDYGMNAFSAEHCDHYSVDTMTAIKQILSNSTAEEIPAAWEAWKKGQSKQMNAILDELNSSYLVQ